MSFRLAGILFSASIFVVSVGTCLSLAVYLAMYRGGGSLDAIEGWGLGWLFTVPGSAAASAAAGRVYPWFGRLQAARQVAAYAVLVLMVCAVGVAVAPVVGAVFVRWA